MRTLVIYESMFGNTKRIANAIADGIARHSLVETVEVSNAPTEIPDEVDLLVVGGPTHIHGMTTARSRSTAAERSPRPLVSRGAGVREWLAVARPRSRPIPAAAFDTRVNGPVLFTGSAATGFAKRLKAAGFRVMAPARSFLIDTKAVVDDALMEGELDKARAWGAAMGEQFGSSRA